MKKNKVTMEKLAGMVQKGFEELSGRMDKGFNEVGGRLISVENRLDAIEMELIDIKKKLENVIYRHEFEYLKDRVKNLEARLASIKKK